MSLSVHFNIFGDQQVDREIRFTGQRASNARPAFAAIGEQMMNIEREQFDSQGARGSGGWDPLKPATVARKGHSTILVDTGALRRSLTTMYDTNQIYDYGDDYIRFGSSLEYGPFHQSGTDRMPARPPVEFTESDRRDFMRLIQGYVITGSVPVI